MGDPGTHVHVSHVLWHTRVHTHAHARPHGLAPLVLSDPELLPDSDALGAATSWRAVRLRGFSPLLVGTIRTISRDRL